jgi:hypothetical protein
MINKECVKNRCFCDGRKGHRGDCKLAIKKRVNLLKSIPYNPLYFDMSIVSQMINFELNKLKKIQEE